MKTKENEKMEYEAPTVNVYELMSEGCILSASNGDQLTDIGTGGEIGSRSTQFSAISSDRGF